MIDENTIETESLETETPEPVQSNSPPSLEDTIRDAALSVQGKKESDEPDTTEAQKQAAIERNRDKQGKFKKGAPRKSFDYNPRTKQALPVDTTINPETPTNGKSKEEEAIEPLQYWNVETKEWFNKQAAPFKKQLLQEAKDREAHTTKLWQNLQGKIKRHEGIDQVIEAYRPQWHMRGIDEGTALRQLAAHYEQVDTNPVAAIHHIMASKNITLESLVTALSNNDPNAVATQSRQQFTQQQPSQNDALQERVNYLTNVIMGAQQAQANQVISGAVGEINTLRNEKHPDGRYKYPKLWDANHLQRVQPLVESVRQTNPAISWKDATLKAHNAILVMDGEAGSLNSNQTRLPQNNSQDLERAKKASVSVRSRGSAQVPIASHTPKPREKVEDTLRATMANMISNRQTF